MTTYPSAHSQQRYGKAKGMKVKHLVQLVALTVLFTWFLYQVNSSYRTRVRSLHAEREDVIDDELLISDDKGGFFRDGVVAHSDIMVTAEFIDKQSVQRARKLLPVDVTDTPELEQIITEADPSEDLLRAERAEDIGVLNDVGERDIDGSSDEILVRRTGARGWEREKARVEGHKKPLSKNRGTETAEGDRGDGEDELAKSRGKEFDDASRRWIATHFTETAEDDTLLYTRNEEIKPKGVDLSEEQRLANPTAKNADDIMPDTETDLKAGSASSEQKIELRAFRKERGEGNLMKQGDGATGHLEVGDGTKSSGIEETLAVSGQSEAEKNLIQNGDMSTSYSAEQMGSKSDKVALVSNGHNKESGVTGKMSSRFPHEFKEETGDGPIPSLHNGADAKALQAGRGDVNGTVAFHGDGHDENCKQDDQPVKEDAIAELVNLCKGATQK